MSEVDRPVAAPSLLVGGGILVLLVELLAVDPSRLPVGVWSVVLVAPVAGPAMAALGLAVHFHPAGRLLYGTAAVFLGFLTFYAPAAGFLLGPLLAIIGGALAIAYESRTDEGDQLDRQGIPSAIRRNFWMVTTLLLVGGVALAVLAPAYPGAACQSAPPCTAGVCPAAISPSVASACFGPSLWTVLIGTAFITGILTFRVRALDHHLPLPV